MIRVLKAGLFTTIQDLGRFGYRSYGVPVSGYMDHVSAKLANALLNNNEDAAVLEMTMVGPKLRFETETYIAISGADISPHLNNNIIQNNKVYVVTTGDELQFKTLKTGLRAYLAVKNGFKTKTILNSKSYYQPITENDILKKNDVLSINTGKNTFIETFSKLKSLDFSEKTIHVFKGPEFELLSDVQKEYLLHTEFKISNLYNRMAYQLKPKLENQLSSILTSPVLPGTVQLTPSGQLIVLMRDCQTTGGYPRILQLTEDAINLLSQKKENDIIRFEI